MSQYHWWCQYQVSNMSPCLYHESSPITRSIVNESRNSNFRNTNKKHANYKDFVGQKSNFNKKLQKYRTINTEIQKNPEVNKWKTNFPMYIASECVLYIRIYFTQMMLKIIRTRLILSIQGRS